MDELQNPTRISALGTSCMARLNRLVDSLDQTDEFDGRLSVEDSRGRFRVWAANMGALLPHSSPKSLGSRVQHAKRLESSMVSGLDRIDRSCSTALQILSGNLPDRNDRLELVDSGSESESDELQELLLNIESAVTLLFDLSMLLRRQRPRGRVRFAPADFQPETASPDINNIGDKFPKTKEQSWLLQRLGNAVTLRRLSIQYRQKQHNGVSKENIKEDDGTATSKATTYSDRESQQNASYTSSTFSAATSFVSHCDSDDQVGRRIPDLTTMTFKGIELAYNKPFECPYCLNIQKVASHWEWKKHVFWDLQPYVCTIKDCVQATQLFDTRESWFHHVKKTHCRFWSCVFCSSESHSLEDLKKHFNHSHTGKITNNQFPFIEGACERLKTDFGCHSCPFCDLWDPVVAQPDRSKTFFRHLARHLQQIALEALPLYIEGLEVKAVASLDKVPEDSELEFLDDERPGFSRCSSCGWTCKEEEAPLECSQCHKRLFKRKTLEKPTELSDQHLNSSYENHEKQGRSGHTTPLDERLERLEAEVEHLKIPKKTTMDTEISDYGKARLGLFNEYVHYHRCANCPVYQAKVKGGRKDEYVWVWTCCQCGESGMSCLATPRCPTCGG